MKSLGPVATCFLIIVAAGAIASVLQLAIIALILIALVSEPLATLTFVGGFVVLGLFTTHPWVMSGLVAFGTIGRWLESRRPKPRPLPRLFRPRGRDCDL